jgi:hypothetical protein
MHNLELHNLYPPLNITAMIKSRRVRWAGHVASMGEMRNAYKRLTKKVQAKKPPERTRDRCEDNNSIYLRQVVRL